MEKIIQFCACENPRKFLLPKYNQRQREGDPWEACGICKYPINPLKEPT